METLDCIKQRRSFRKYKNEVVDQKLIDQIIEAGLYAPTGRNLQSSIVIQIKDETVRNELKKINQKVMGVNDDVDPFYNAPVLLVVLAKKDVRTYIYDGTCMMENMMLAAKDLGLDSIWVHRAKQEFESEYGKALLKKLNIEEDYEGIGNLLIGYGNGEIIAAPRKENRVFTI